MRARKISCADCRWGRADFSTNYYYCFNDKQPRRVHRKWVIKGKQCKSLCSLARVGNMPGDCGINAQYFENTLRTMDDK